MGQGGEGFFEVKLGDLLYTCFHDFGITMILKPHHEEKVRKGTTSRLRWGSAPTGTPGAHLGARGDTVGKLMLNLMGFFPIKQSKSKKNLLLNRMGGGVDKEQV